MEEKLYDFDKIEDIYPLSDIQVGMLYESLIPGTASAYYSQTQEVPFRDKDFNFDLFKRALSLLVDKHPMLRTGFDLENPEKPVQVVYKKIPLEIGYHDLCGTGPAAREAYIKSCLQREREKCFNLSGAEPLWRSILFKTGEEEYYFAHINHHAIHDGWSLASFLTELNNTYIRLKVEPNFVPAKLKSTYKNFIIEQVIEKKNVKTIEFWKNELSDYKRFEIPGGEPGSIGKTDKIAITRDIGIQTLEKLVNMAKKYGISLRNIFFAAYVYTLYMVSYENDFVVGMVTHVRPEVEDGEKIIGPFLNEVPVRVRIPAQLKWIDFIRSIDRKLTRLTDYNKLSLLEIARIIGEITQGKNPIFETIFTYTDFHVYNRVDRSLLGGMGTDTGDNPSLLESEQFVTNTSLDFIVDISGILNVIFFDSLLTNEMVERLCRYFMKVLRCFSDEPGTTARKEVIMTGEEREKILYEFNKTEAGFPRGKTIHRLFEEQVERRPNQVALVGPKLQITNVQPVRPVQLTYRQLNEESDRLAGLLIEKGVRPDTIVGIMVERSLEMVIGILAILKSGGAYLPIDPDYPEERINYMLADSDAKIVLTSDAINRVPTPNHLPIHLSTLISFSTSTSTLTSTCQVGPASLAYIIYTSGTTGKPKGSLIEHRNVVSLMVHDHYLFKFGGSDVWTMFHSYCFDFSVWEMYGALLYGGKLVIISRMTARDPQQYLQILKEQQVTILNQTPAAFYQLARQELDTPGSDLRLKYVIFGGEALTPARLKPWKEKYPRTKLINMFGITETTVHVTYKEIDQKEIESNIGNIGGPLPTLHVYVMDRNQKLQPIGVPGELWVGGAGVCRGYLSQPGLTAEKFCLRWPGRGLFEGTRGLAPLPHSPIYRSGDLGRWLPHGNIEYLGRIDHQVKIRGYRVELGEIEAQSMRHFAVKEAVALEWKEPDGLKALNVYVVPDFKYAYPVKQFMELEKQGRLENRSYHEYPNGMTIFYLNRHETDFMYREIFEEQSYIKHGITLEEGACIFDVGANIGMFSLFVHHTCKNSKIYAFEPIPPIFEVLILNTSIYCRNVEVLPWGLSQNESEAVFTYYPHAVVLSGRYADRSQETETVKAYIKNEIRENPGKEQLSENQVNELLEERLKSILFTCKMKSLSQVIREKGIEKIDLVKIDVEKAEMDVLNGIDDTDWPKIRQLVLEVHNVDERLEEISQKLRQRGYRVVHRQDNELKNTGLYNVYAVSEAKSLSGKQYPAPEKKKVDKACDYYLSPRQFIDDMRTFLKEKVPEYMVPSHFFLLDHIPLNHNGKIDRKALPGPGIKTGTGYIAPRNQEEVKLVEIWAEVLSLGKEKMSTDENFFNLGGHSLKATVMVVKVREVFHVQLPLVQVFKTPTISGLAKYINQVCSEQMLLVNDNHLVLLKEGSNRDKPLFFIHDGTGDVEGYVELCKNLKIDNRCWGIQAAPLENYTPVNLSVENIAANYIKTLRKLQPHGPYCMAGWSLGGVIAFEMAVQLEGKGEKISFLGLIDSPTPIRDANEKIASFTVETERNLLMDYLPADPIKKKVKDVTHIYEIWPLVVNHLEVNNINVETVKPLIPDALARVIPNYDRVGARDLIYYLNMHRTLARALTLYLPARPIDTPVHYFKAGQSPETVKKGWHDYCKKSLKIHQIEGDHFSILRKPAVSRMGEIFTAVFTSFASSSSES